jgi:hypothetical protein
VTQTCRSQVTVSGSKVRGSRKNTGQVRSLSGQGVPETRLDNRLVGDCWVVPNSRFVGSSAGAPRGFQPDSKKKGGEPLPTAEREEGEEGEEGQSRMCLEPQNLRTPSASDAVTDGASSGNGHLLPHDLDGN